MPIWAKLGLAVLVLALGLVLGVWLHSTLSGGGDEVKSVVSAPRKQHVRHIASPAVTKTLPPASAGTNHPQKHHASASNPAAAQASFASLESSLGASIGLAVAPLGSGQPQTYGELQVGHAWSSMKVPIVVTLMREGGLSAEEEGWARSAITASDNEAAAALFQQLEDTHGGLSGASLAVQETLASAGDASTQIATAPPPPGAVSTWGQTEWSLSGSVDFYRALACGQLLESSGTGYVLGLMEEVVPEQQWGLGEASFPEGTSVAFKAGWGPEATSGGGYLVRQAGIIRMGSTGAVVTMMAEDPSGSFEAGVQDIDQVASWVSQNLDSLATGSC